MCLIDNTQGWLQARIARLEDDKQDLQERNHRQAETIKGLRDTVERMVEQVINLGDYTRN